jgi:hypothetical protein
MQENTQNKSKLPGPKWFFFIIGVPTFYMPLMYLANVAIFILVMLFGIEAEDVPELVMAAIYSAIYVTFVLWPIYIVWVVFSKKLAWREKLFWLFVVTILNMLGMPMFYIFMIRRYLGLEGRIGKRDEAALDALLRRCAISREQLSASQLKILGTYCRKHRLTKWALVPTVPLAAFLIYAAIFIVPKHCITLHSDLTPTRVVIIDSTTNTKEEMAADPETEKLFLQLVMMFGAMAGSAGTTGIFILILVISQQWFNYDRKAFFDFLKATDKKNLNKPST